MSWNQLAESPQYYKSCPSDLGLYTDTANYISQNHHPITITVPVNKATIEVTIRSVLTLGPSATTTQYEGELRPAVSVLFEYIPPPVGCIVFVAEQVFGLMLLPVVEVWVAKEVLVVEVIVVDDEEDEGGRRFGHIVVMDSMTVALRPTSVQRDVVQFEIISSKPGQVQKPV